MSTPSQRDGLRPDQEAAFKRTAINTIITAGERLHMDQLATYTAAAYLHRFYRTKSLVRNDPFLVGMACLYLGGKVEDSPKSIRDVLVASCEIRYGEPARRLTHDKALYEALREKVFIAERALLYALSFDFNVDHVYKPFVEMLKEEPLLSYREREPAKVAQMLQFAVNLMNDSVKTEACLHYKGVVIAAACIWLAMKLMRAESHVLTAGGQLWWAAKGVKEEQLEGVEALLQPLYNKDMYALYASNDLVLQSVAQVQPAAVLAVAMAEQQQQRKAAAAAGGAREAAATTSGASVGAGALPPEVAAANRDSWAVPAAAPPPPREKQQSAASVANGSAAAAEKTAANGMAQTAAVQAAAEDDYDEFLF